MQWWAQGLIKSLVLLLSSFTPDTEAMAGLAFICLTQATVYTPDLLAELGQAVHRVKGNILQAQTPTGTFGNIYSSPLAMQVSVKAI